MNVDQDKLKRLTEVYGGFVKVQYEAEAGVNGTPDEVVQRRVDRARFEFRQAVGTGNYGRVSPLKLMEVADYVGVPRRSGEALASALDRYLGRMS